MLLSTALLTAPAHCAESSTAVPTSTSGPAAPSSLTAVSTNSLKERLDKVLERAVKNQTIVGAVVAVAQDGKVIYKRAVGYADREKQKAMQEDTIFRLASMSKTVVTAAALKLVEQGKLHLADKVSDYLPDFKPQLASGTIPDITISQLLTHTSGLGYGFSEKEDGPYHLARVSDGLDQPGLSLAENLKRLASVPLLFQPGSKWNYSLSIDVLGAVLEKAAGEPLQDIVKENVTRPLHMQETKFWLADDHRLATPYFDNLDKSQPPLLMAAEQKVATAGGYFSFAPARVFDKTSYPSGGAGLVGTAGDYLKFLEALRSRDQKLLKTESFILMSENQIGDLRISPGGDWGFTYGAAILLNGKPEKGPHKSGTIQWGGAYGHHWFVDPLERLSVVGLTNTTTEGMTGAFTKDVAKAIYGSKHD